MIDCKFAPCRSLGLGLGTPFGSGPLPSLHGLPEIVEAQRQTGSQVDLRLPTEQALRLRDVWTALDWIVLGKRREADLAR